MSISKQKLQSDFWLKFTTFSNVLEEGIEGIILFSFLLLSIT